MDRIHYSDIQKLASDTSEPKVSLYMPLHRQPAAQSKQDMLQLRNLLQEAQNRLRSLGLSAQDVTKILEPGHRLVSSEPLWRYGARSLALFASLKSQMVMRIGVELEEKLVVNSHFHLVPLIETVVAEQPFYVLAINQDHPRLIYATSQYSEEISVKDMPTSIQEVSKYKQYSKDEQGRSGIGPSAGTAYYSKGVDEASMEENLVEFLRLVDRAVNKALKKDPLHLILVGQENHVASYRKISKYPKLVRQFIAGNPSHIPADKLVNRAQDLMQPLFDQHKQQAVGRYLELAAKQRSKVSDKLEAIVSASKEGRIDTLLVPSSSVVQPVHFYEQLGTGAGASSHKRAVIRREEAIDQAILETIRNGGEVYPLSPTRIPGYGKAAAILRY